MQRHSKTNNMLSTLLSSPPFPHPYSDGRAGTAAGRRAKECLHAASLAAAMFKIARASGVADFSLFLNGFLCELSNLLEIKLFADTFPPSSFFLLLPPSSSFFLLLPPAHKGTSSSLIKSLTEMSRKRPCLKRWARISAMVS